MAGDLSGGGPAACALTGPSPSLTGGTQGGAAAVRYTLRTAAARPMRHHRPTPRRRDAPRWTAEEWEAVTTVLWYRCRSVCDVCMYPLISSAERHHRQRREVGGDRLSNLLLLHPNCHALVHAHPEESRDKGWIVSAFARDPAIVPVAVGGAWYWLDDHGGRRVAPGLGNPTA